MTVRFRQGDMFDHTQLHNLHCPCVEPTVQKWHVAIWTAEYIQTCTKHAECSVLLFIHTKRLRHSVVLPESCQNPNVMLLCFVATEYTHEGLGHCLLKFSNWTGCIKVIKWTNSYTPLRNYSYTSGNHTCSYPSLVYFLMSDITRVWKKNTTALHFGGSFWRFIQSIFFVEREKTWMHKIFVCVTKLSIWVIFWELLGALTGNLLTCPGKPKWSGLGAV